jgi:hypothetical protein
MMMMKTRISDHEENLFLKKTRATLNKLSTLIFYSILSHSHPDIPISIFDSGARDCLVPDDYLHNNKTTRPLLIDGVGNRTTVTSKGTFGSYSTSFSIKGFKHILISQNSVKRICCYIYDNDRDY